MKNRNVKGGHRNFSDDYDSNSGIKGSGAKAKGSKNRLSIYEDFEEDEDEFVVREKFKKRHK